MTTRRLMTGMALLSAATLALAACGGGDADTDTDAGAGAEDTMGAGGGASEEAVAEFPADSTMAAIVEAGTLRVGTKFDQPGFGLANLEGAPEGFDVEIAKIIAEELGIDEGSIEYTETPSAIREEVLVNGDVDLVAATYTINDERAERIDFAGPYYVAGQALMVRTEDEETITSPDDLSDTAIRVCSVNGSTPSETIREYLGSEDQLTLFETYSECADAMANDQVDVVTTDNVILLGLVEASEGAFTLVGEAFTEEPYGIGVTNEDVEFCQFINDSLEKANEDGRYLEAWDATAGSIAGAEEPQFPELTPCA